MNCIDAFDRAVRCYPETDAVRTDDGRRYTYAELDDRTDRLANALESLASGERIATLAHNGPEAIETMIASHKRGVGNVQLPFMSSPAGLAGMLEPIDASVLVFDDANAEKALDVFDRSDLSMAVSIDGAETNREAVYAYDELLDDAPAGRPESHANEHGILFTSGTTSASKAVPFDQDQLWYGGTQVIMEMNIDHGDVALLTTPWYHMVTTAAWILPHLQAGATIVIQESFDPPETLRLLDEHDATGLLAVPTQLHALVDETKRGDYELDALSYIRTGGSVVTERLSELVNEHLCDGLYNTYGLTEGGPNLTFADPETQREKPGTIGKESFMWELRVVDSAAHAGSFDPTAEVDAGETGEVIGRSPGMCEGYLGRPDATRNLLVDGWLRTGDVARVDEDGHLYIVDRVDNMIISGGENVYPQEVEEVLATHDAVTEVAVIGLDDEVWGERIAAVVRTNEADLCEADLETFCTDHDELADFKRPREYTIVEKSLPRTDTGKIRREAVHTEFF
ncbi:class I adenylate-forming enzyme family protein [Halorubrum sp. DTA98]|uniref:class I adenylate-forming enzyme family protein n=1 Tax=Halorubrum sp. DTA98 TaxID=3402163 RepID=UPI003AADCAB8